MFIEDSSFAYIFSTFKEMIDLDFESNDISFKKIQKQELFLLKLDKMTIKYETFNKKLNKNFHTLSLFLRLVCTMQGRQEQCLLCLKKI